MQSFSSFIDLLVGKANQHPDHRAFIFLQNGESESTVLTYRQLDQRARSIAAHLRARGLEGERALLLFNPDLEFITCFFGCLYANVIAVPAYPPRSRQLLTRLTSIIEDADAAVALTSKALIESIASRLQESDTPLRQQDCVATDELPIELASQWVPPELGEDSLAFLQYTSGSTGDPKGVMVSHGNLIHNSGLIRQYFQNSHRTVGVSWLPPYHDMGLIGGILQPLYVGGTMVLMPPAAFLQRPFRWLSAISRYRASTSGGPNFAYELCIKQCKAEQIAELDLSHWTLAFSGAEPIRASTVDAFVNKFGPYGFRREAFFPCYGLAENTLIVTGAEKGSAPVCRDYQSQPLARNVAIESDPQDGAPSRTLVGCGTAKPGLELAIVDPETGVRQDPGRIGEIWVSGASVARGYWMKPERSREIFQAQITAGGNAAPSVTRTLLQPDSDQTNVSDPGPRTYLRTGDLGFLKDGQLFVTGRRKDLIIIRGRNHYPQDIEATVQACHQDLRTGCVAAFSIEDAGEEKLVLVQEVERSALRRLDTDAVTRAIRLAVADGHDLQPAAIVLLRTGGIPKTSSGKIQRYACRERFLEGSLDVVGEWHAPAANGDSRTTQAGIGKQFPGSHASIRHPEQAPSGIQTKEQRRIQQWFCQYLAKLLGMQPEEIDIEAPLSLYGLDSLAAVRLSADLQDWLAETQPASKQIIIEPTLAYDYPTIAQIAAYLGGDSASGSVQLQPTARPAENDAVVVVGFGCRLPGAESPEAYWQLLQNGASAIVQQEDKDRYLQSQLHQLDRNIFPAGLLNNVDSFDAPFFGISAREAEQLDPQQRLLLEVAWEAFEQAGIDPENWSGSKSGVFVGISSSDYVQLQPSPQTSVYWGTGNAHSIAANRLSYLLNLKGPSMAVDTACSSSLVALHLASKSIEMGDCDQAIAAGVNLLLSPTLSETFRQAGMLSPTGRCRTFDADADGYVRGEGCGVVILKRLSHAIKDRDKIWGVIRGSAINQDGRSNGLTAPNGLAQQAVVREAMQSAGIQPAEISYVETHGTGTALGDPIELNALRQVILDRRSDNQTCWVGSVKTNIGHLEAAAGIAGFIKVLLALDHRQIPPHLHLNTLNPLIQLQNTPIRIPTRLEDWPGEVRTAGVSSFGFGGTNAHVIVSSPPPQQPAEPKPRPAEGRAAERPWHLLRLSARSEAALLELIGRHARHLDGTSENLPDICFTANACRSTHVFRGAWVTQSRPALAAALHSQSVNPGKETEVIPDLTSFPVTRAAGSVPVIAFLFSGQGSQYAQMGRELYDTQPIFREMIDRCDLILSTRPSEFFHHPSLKEILYGETAHSASSLIDQTKITQPALFAFEVALCRLWESWGVRPDWVMGHSVGEYTAAHIAGVFDLEAGLNLIAARAELMDSVSPSGAMVVALANEGAVQSLIDTIASEIVIAAYNGPDNIVLSGPVDAIEDFRHLAERMGIKVRRLAVSQAFHSPMMAPIVENFRQVAAGVKFCRPCIPIISNITHEPIGEEIAHADYWCKHILAPVYFCRSMETLQRQGVQLFLEIGPKPTLIGMGRRCLINGHHQWLASLRPNRSESRQMLESLAQLHLHGVPIDWQAFDRPFARRRVQLPTYPWQWQRYWLPELGPSPEAPMAASDAPREPILFGIDWRPLTLPDDPAGTDPRPGAPSGQWLLLASERTYHMFRQLLPAGQSCSWIEPSESLTHPGPQHWTLDPDNHRHWPTVFAEVVSRQEPVLGILDCLADDLDPGPPGPKAATDGPPRDTNPRSLAAIEAIPHRSLQHLLLAQSLLNQDWQGSIPRLWIVTGAGSSTQEVSPDRWAAVRMLSNAVLSGFARSFAAECPNLWGGLIEISSFSSLADLAHVAREINHQRHPSTQRELQVSYRDGQRRVARLRHASEDQLRLDAAAAKTSAREFPSEDGSYLISGGLGALGLRTAEWLIDHGARALILVSRRQPDQTVQSRLETWRQRNVAITVVCCDISEPSCLVQIRRSIAATGLALRGIFHLAGVLDDASIPSLKPEQWERVIRAKLQGAWLLHELSLDQPVDCFVLYSSVASIFGSPGQSHYAAANAALDALATYRRTQNLPALSVNWGPWSGGGMAGRDQESTMRSLKGYGIHPLSPEVNLDILMRLVRSGLAGEHRCPVSIGVFQPEWAVLRQVVEDHPLASFLADLPAGPEAAGAGPPPVDSPSPRKRALLAMKESQQADYLTTYLREILAHLLQVPVATLKPDDHLMQVGVDSLMVMEAIATLQKDFDLMIYPRELYEHPRLDSLASYLAAEFNRTQNISQCQSPPVPRGNAASRDDRRLTPLSLPAPAQGSPPHSVPQQKLATTAFLLSTPRAGSTLLRVMLAGHPQLLSPPELHLLPFATMKQRQQDLSTSHLGEGLQRLLMDLQHITAQESDHLVQQWVDDELSIAAVYGKLQSLSGGRLLVDKSPSYAMHLETLEKADEMFQRPKFIHLVRHPYAMIHSFVSMRMDRLLGADEGVDPYILAEHIWTSCNRNILHFKKQLGVDRYHLVIYEELVASPERVLTSLCDFLGVAFLPALMDPYQGDRLTDGVHPQSMAVGDPNFHRYQAVDASLADRWKQLRLPSRLAAETCTLARSFGYELPLESSAAGVAPRTVPFRSPAQPASPPRVMRERMFTVGDLNLCICEWGPDDGPPVLCLHGVLDQGLIWESVAAPLAEAGYRVMAPDLRGHGKSSHVGAGGSYQLLDFVADIVTLVDQMVERPMVVVGHSLGSVVATVLTGLRPHLVEQLILVEPVLPRGPQPENPLAGIKTLIEYVSSPPIHTEMKDMQQAIERLRQALPSLTTDFAERLCRRGTVPSGNGLIWSWDPILRSRTSLNMQNGPITRETYLNILSDIKLPITTIHGTDSTFNRGEDLAALQLVLQHANRKVITGGHNLPVESPEEVVSVILDVLASAHPEINTIEGRI